MNNQLKVAMAEAEQAFALGDYERTLNKCRFALALNKEALGAYVLAGNACFVMRRFEEAEKFYGKAVSLDEKNGEYYFCLGNALAAQNRLQEALRCYADAELLKCSDRTRQKLYYTMGKINQRSNDLQEALLNYKKAESIPGNNPDLGEILLNRVEIYVSQGNWEDAENCAMQLKLLMPTQFKSYQLLFQIMLQQKKTDDAAKLLADAEKYCEATKEKRIELIFDHAMIHCFLAELEPEKMKEHFQDASKWLDNLYEITDLPQDVDIEAKLTCADMQLKMGNYEKAMEICQTIAELNDSELLEYIEKACFVMVDCCKFIEDFKQMKYFAGKLKSSKTKIYCHQGYYSEFWAVNRLAKNDESFKKEATDLYNRAIAHYKQACVENAMDFVAFVYRAQMYADVGDFEQAEKLCEMLPAEARTTLSEHIASCKASQS